MTDRVVKVVLRGQVTDFIGGMRAATSATKATVASMTEGTKEANAFRQNLTTVGNTAGKIGLVAAAGVAVAVRSFANFDQAISNVAATGDDAKGNIDALREAAIKMGASTQFSATEAANAIEELEKAGVSAKEILGGGLKGALDLAAAGGLAVADAASIAATAMVQFNLTGDKVPHIADLLAAAAGKAQGSVTDMGQALKYVGPVASQMGISIEETTGVIAELANSGILADQAGTSLRGMLTSLTSPSKIAKTQMEELGITLYDATGNFIGFDGVAGQLQDTLGTLSNAERDQALGRIFGNEQITAARVLYAGGAEDVAKWTKAVDDNGFAAETAATKMDNLKGDLEQLSGAFETALIGTGAGADGPLRTLVQDLTGLVNAYNKLPGPIKEGALAAGGLTAAVGGTLFVASKAVGGYANMSKSLGGLGIDFENVNKKALLFKRGGALAAAAGLAAISGPAHEADESLGQLTDVAAGAAAGFAVGGPWGAAIGGGIALLSSLGSSSTDTAADMAGLTATLDQQSGALSANTASWVAKSLADNDAAGILEAMGVSLTTVTDAVLGNKAAMDEVTAATDKLGTVGDSVLDPITKLRDGLASSQEATRSAAQAADESTVASEGAATAIAGTGDAAGTAAQQVQTYADSLKGLLDPLLDQDAASNAWKDSLASLTHDLRENGTSLDDSTVKGRKNQDAIRARVSALKDSVAADEAAGVGQDELSAKLQRGAKRILEAGTAANISKDKMRGYLHQLGLTPAQIKTLIRADTDDAMNKVRNLQGFIDGMHGKTVKVKVEGGTPGGQLVNANGSITDYYADGGLRENHVAQIAPAGAMRVWAEPETGGEAYIPFAQSKRKRSQEIAIQTVSRLGGVASFANGGTTGNASTSVDLVATGIAPAIGAAVKRALYGTTFQILPDGSVRAKEMGA